MIMSSTSVTGRSKRSTPEVPEKLSGAASISPAPTTNWIEPDALLSRARVTRPGFRGNSMARGTLRFEWSVPRGVTCGSAIESGARPQCHRIAVSCSRSKETTSVPNAGSPLNQPRIICVSVPFASASQLHGIQASESIDIAPHAAHPRSVKNSGQQRTAKPPRSCFVVRPFSARNTESVPSTAVRSRSCRFINSLPRSAYTCSISSELAVRCAGRHLRGPAGAH